MYNLKKPEIEHFNFGYRVEKKMIIEGFDMGTTAEKNDENEDAAWPKQEGASTTYQFSCYKKARQVEGTTLKRPKSEDEEKRFLKQMVDGIKYFATLNDDRVRLVQFGQKGYYVLDFKRLNQLYDRDDINLTSRLVYGKTSDGIKIPKVIIYDNETNTDLLTIRMFRNAAGYVRNYIEKEALMVKLTKVRGTK